jgi:hypothetical protein
MFPLLELSSAASGGGGTSGYIHVPLEVLVDTLKWLVNG